MWVGMSGPVQLEDVQIKLVRQQRPAIGTVVSNDLCMNGKSASYVRHTVIDVSGTALAGVFRVGQSFGVVPPGTDEQGKPHKIRLYSLACASWGEDGRGNLISTTPKRLIDEFVDDGDVSDHHLFLGVCSNYLCDLRPGDSVRLTGPNGKRFLLPTDPGAHDYLFLATGTGIAPFRGMVLELLDNPAGACASEIHLVMGSPYATDLLYHDLFERLAADHPNFHYHTAISRERRLDGGRGLYVHDLLTERLDEFAPLLEGSRTLIYVCGVPGMRAGLFRMLARHGLDSAYLARGKHLNGVAPSAWSDADIKRGIRPTDRCMLEIY